MTLRVYLEDNEGRIHNIDYGLEAKNYKRVVKVELCEETSKLKDSLNTILIDDKKSIYGTRSAPEKKRPTYTNGYEIFDNNLLHGIDEEYYWIQCLCTNCFQTSQVVIKKGEPYNQKKLKLTVCPHCQLSTTLKRARWNGKEYVVIKK